MNNNKKFLMMGAGGLAVAVIMMLVVGINVFGPPAGADDRVCEGVEGEIPTYFADQAPEGSNHFGPAAPSESVEAAVSELKSRVCLDPSLAVATSGYLADEALDDSTYSNRVNAITGNRDAWLFGVGVVKDDLDGAETVEIEEISATYWTEYFVRQEGAAPLLRQSQESMVGEKMLKFTWADGRVKRFKLSCGFQPVEPNEFPGVPPMGEPPSAPPAPRPPTSNPPGPTTPTNPPTTPTTKDGKDHTECAPSVCLPRTSTTRTPTTTTPPPAPPSTVTATTLEPVIPDNPTCIGGDCPNHPSPPSTVEPPVAPPNTVSPTTNVPPPPSD